MDSKAESKLEQPCPSPTGNIVVDLLEFAMRVVNKDLSPFFEKNCDLWDYSEEDIEAVVNGKGESLEQHAVYREYVDLMTDHLDRFAEDMGFSSQKEVFLQVEDAIQKDKEQRTKLMSEISAMFRKLKVDDDAKAEPKEEKEETKDEGGPPPLLIFSQPIGLEFLLTSVLNLAEYETLRMMMILKSKEMRMIKDAKKRRKDRKISKERRKDIFQNKPTIKDLLSEFKKLKSRIIDLAPSSDKTFHATIDAAMDIRILEDDLEDSIDARADHKIYDFAVDHLSKIIGSAANFHGTNNSKSREDFQEAIAELKNTSSRHQATHAHWIDTLHDTIDTLHDDLDDRIKQLRSLADDDCSQGADEK